MSLPWFRAYAEMVDDDKLRLLAFEDRWHFVAILCCKAQGILDSPPALARRKVAVKLGLAFSELDEVARRLAEVELIDKKTLEPLAWNRRQFVSDHDNSAAERQRRRRQRLKESIGNGSVTDSSRVTSRNGHGSVTRPDTDTDTDTDTELEKNGICKEQIPHVISASPKRPAVPVRDIVYLYHQILPMCPQVRKLTDTRRKQIEARWRGGDLPDLETWRSYFEFCAESKFLTGTAPPMNGHKPFVADLEWLSRESNYAKVFERKYHR